MTLYDDDFAGNADLAAPPAGWTPIWQTSGISYTVRNGAGVTPAGTVDAAALRPAISNGFQTQALRWDAPGSGTDGEMLVRFRATAGAISGQAGVLGFRLSTSGSNFQGYNVGFHSGLLRLGTQYAAGNYTLIASSAFALPADTWVGVRAKWAGTRLQVRAWLATATEPTTWMIDVIHDPAVVGGIAWSNGHAGIIPGGPATADRWWDRVQLGTAGSVPNFLFPEAPVPKSYHELVIYEVDGVTPAWTFTTDPAGQYPYLIPPKSWSDSRIDPLTGGGGIGQANMRLLDKRTVAADQGTGFITSILSNAGGEFQLYNRRALWRSGSPAGGWDVIFDGTVGDTTLDDSLVAYSIPLRDTRDQERRARVFTKARDTAILPPSIQAATAMVMVDAMYPGTPQADSLRGDVRVITIPYNELPYTPPAKGNGWELLPDELWLDASAGYMRARPVLDVSTGQTVLRFADCAVAWTTDPTGATAPDWTILENMRAYRRSTNAAIGPEAEWATGVVAYRDTAHKRIVVYLQSDDPAKLPASGPVSVQVLSRKAPTKEHPIIVWGTFGSVLAALYDGVYSERNADGSFRPTGVRYDPDYLTGPLALPAMGRRCYAVISEPVDDLRGWAQKHIYQATNTAPAIINGRVVPVACGLPSITPVLALSTANVAPGGSGWEMAGSEAINKVTVKYRRDFMGYTGHSGLRSGEPYRRWAGQAEPEVFGDTTHRYPSSYLDRLASQEAEAVALDGASVVAIGEKELTLELTTVRDVGQWDDDGLTWRSYYQDGDPGAATVMGRLTETIRRFRYGAQHITLRARRGDPLVRAAKLGDWARVTLPWMPNMITKLRGLDSLAQIIRIRVIDGAWQEMELVDAGPYAAQLAAPTVAGIVWDSDALVVTFGTIPAGATAVVQAAISPTVPPEGSPLWLPAGETPSVAAPVRTAPFNDGATVWMRYRSEAGGRISSAWTVHNASLILAGRARLAWARMFISSGQGIVRATWAANVTTLGVRIDYEISGPGGVSTSSVDVDAAAGEGVVATLRQGERIEATMTPYTGWTGSAVTGTAGTAIPMGAVARQDIIPAVYPTVQETVAEEDGNGVLTLDMTDPQLRLTKMETAAMDATTREWSAWTDHPLQTDEPSIEATVPVPAGATSAIRYRLSGVREDGVVLNSAAGRYLIENIVPVGGSVAPGGSVTFGVVSYVIDVAADEIDLTTSVTGAPAEIRLVLQNTTLGTETIVTDGALDVGVTFTWSETGSGNYTNDTGHGIDLHEFDDPGGPWDDFLLRAQFRAYDGGGTLLAASTWRTMRVYGTM